MLISVPMRAKRAFTQGYGGKAKERRVSSPPSFVLGGLETAAP